MRGSAQQACWLKGPHCGCSPQNLPIFFPLHLKNEIEGQIEGIHTAILHQDTWKLGMGNQVSPPGAK